MLLDSSYNIATPEGVELRLPVAGLGPRSLAWLVDALIKLVGLSIASAVLQFMSEFGTGVYLVLFFLTLWFYNVLFEVLNHGATPGKQLLGIRVANANGTPVSWGGSLLRNLIRFVDSLPGTYAFGCASMLLSENFQRLGDLAAGTVVVYKARQQRPAADENLEAEAVKVPLSPEEQQAIVSFGERVPSINAERAEELSAILVPVFGEIDAKRLRKHANWLAGRGARP